MKLQLLLTLGYIVNMFVLLKYGDLGTFGQTMLFVGLALCFLIDYATYKLHR